MPVFGAGQPIIMGRRRSGSLAAFTAASSTVTPDDVAGLVAWYDASQITGLNNNDPLTTWDDSSGNSHPLGQGTAGFKPLYVASGIGGRPSLEFDGADDHLNDATISLAQPSMTFVVARTDAPTTLQQINDGVTTRQSMLIAGGSGALTYFAGSAISTGIAAGASAFVFVAAYNGASSAAWVNGAAGVAGNAGTQSLVQQRLGVDNTAGSNRFNGQIAEMFHYSRVLNSTERGQLTAYLGTKYGISVV